MTQEQTQRRLAVLIDADNTPAAIVEGLFAEIAKYGNASVRRIYGDWTTTRLKGWKDVLLDFAVQPMQQFGYTTGKNSTDSAMIIDAMDILYTERLDGFCIVSSDSDFTRLASRIREAGLMVLGFGERKTPRPFVGACDRFIFTEILRGERGEVTPKVSGRKPAPTLRGDTRLVELLRNAVEDCADDSGWAFLGAVGNNIATTTPDFDSRNYGYGKLGDLMRATKLFAVDERPQVNSPAKQIYVRDSRQSG